MFFAYVISRNQRKMWQKKKRQDIVITHYPSSRGDLWRERGAKRGRGKPSLVESVGNLASMLSPSTEIEP